MDYKKALIFMFKDPKGFSKLMLGMILSAIPLINILAEGYLVEVASNAFSGSEGLPKWDDWGQKFVKGLTVGIYAFIYSLPFLLILFVYFFATSGMADYKGFSQRPIGQLVSLFYSFLLPAIVVQYVRYSKKLVKSIRLDDVLSLLRRNLKTVIVLAMLYFAGVGVPMLIMKMYYSANTTTGLVLTAAVAAIPGFYFKLFLYNLYGQLLVNDEKRMGQALATSQATSQS